MTYGGVHGGVPFRQKSAFKIEQARRYEPCSVRTVSQLVHKEILAPDACHRRQNRIRDIDKPFRGVPCFLYTLACELRIEVHLPAFSRESVVLRDTGQTVTNDERSADVPVQVLDILCSYRTHCQREPESSGSGPRHCPGRRPETFQGHTRSGHPSRPSPSPRQELPPSVSAKSGWWAN